MNNETTKTLYEVIGMVAGEEGFTGKIDDIYNSLIFNTAVQVAEKWHVEVKNNPDHRYGAIGIEKNSYEKDEYGNWELEQYHRTYFKTTDGDWQ